MSAPTPPKIPRLLAIAERWAKSAGKKVDRGAVVKSDGSQDPVLRVLHGQNPVIVRVEGDCIVVFGLTQIPDEVRKNISARLPADQQLIAAHLREQLLSDGRIGYALLPTSAPTVWDADQVATERLIYIKEEDASTRNAFLDAIQEVVVVMHRFLIALNILGSMKPIETGTAPAPPGKPPEAMYG